MERRRGLTWVERSNWSCLTGQEEVMEGRGEGNLPSGSGKSHYFFFDVLMGPPSSPSYGPRPHSSFHPFYLIPSRLIVLTVQSRSSDVKHLALTRACVMSWHQEKERTGVSLDLSEPVANSNLLPPGDGGRECGSFWSIKKMTMTWSGHQSRVWSSSSPR